MNFHDVIVVGAWQHAWESLRLFSPAAWSSIAGWPLPRSDHEYPHRDEVIDYLRRYEERYGFNIQRSVRVTDIDAVHGGFQLKSACGQCWYARTVVLATGTWRNPYIPPIPGRDVFSGQQLHSAFYKCPGAFTDQHVLVVGGANSGAQILAEVSHTAASTTWVALEPPRFLPDDVDGRVLFDRATARWRALQEGRTPPPAAQQWFG